MTTEQPWPWPDRMDALLAAPASHRVLVDFESQPPPRPGVRVRWIEPEGPHSVENTGQHRYHAIRVELK